MQMLKYPKRSEWDEILKRPVIDSSSLESIVSSVLDDVKNNGDKAVKAYTLKFDMVDLKELKVNPEELKNADKECSEDLKLAINLAIKNIKVFHSSQKDEVNKIEITKGVTCWRKSTPIEKVGLYIPGGTAPLFSTVLMLAVPAQIAGCKEIILCTPPGKEGKVDSAILYSANLLGVDVYKIGGVQAIGAMAYGTETVPKTYKIFGPGNQYVTCAKQLINKEGVSIDMPAGPSEVLVMADKTSKPEFVASDLLSQAEHGIDSQVILVCQYENVIEEVMVEVSNQLKQLPRREMAAKTLKNSKAILVKDEKEMIGLSNEYAPEHLIIACENNESIAEQITNAGSVFLGNYTPESAGDYASGTNHTLPTNGFAKSYSGVSLDSFVKKITFQKITQQGIREIGPAIEVMAEAEQLIAHKNAVTLRLK